MRLKEYTHVIQLGTKIHISSKGSLQPLFQYMTDDQIYWDIKLLTYRLAQLALYSANLECCPWRPVAPQQ